MPTTPPEDRARRPRPYHRSGLHAVSRALPQLMERVADPNLPEAALTPVEQAARAWRAEVLNDLGGAAQVPATRVAIVDAAVGSKIILDSIDRYLFSIAAQEGLVNRRNRKAYLIVEQRMRVADSLARQLQAVGLDRVAKRVTDLNSYIEARYGAASDGEGEPAPPTTEPARVPRQPVPVTKSHSTERNEP